MTSVNFSKKGLGTAGTEVLAAFMSRKFFENSGVLASLTFSGGAKDDRGDWVEGKAVIVDTAMTEADFSGKNLGTAGAQILAAFMGRQLFQGTGSLSKLKMDTYELPVQEIKTATELDLSNKGLGKLDAIVIAVLIKVRKFQNRFVTN
jgi:hypothetical protein